MPYYYYYPGAFTDPTPLPCSTEKQPCQLSCSEQGFATQYGMSCQRGVGGRIQIGLRALAVVRIPPSAAHSPPLANYSELDWDVIWADVGWVRENFDRIHLDDHQRVNHFRNHYELTRKDLLVKNVNRMKKQVCV